MYDIARSNVEIDEQYNRALEAVDEGRTQYPGMTFEEGVIAVLDWLFRGTDTPPMEDE